jgi:ectoine hydroxylase
MDQLTMKLAAHEMNAYKRDEYLVQDQALSEEATDLLLARTLSFQAHTYTAHVLEKDGKTYRAFHGCHLYDDAYKELIRAPQFLEPAQQLLDDHVYIHQLKLNVKQAFSGEMWPWHQDYIYWFHGNLVHASPPNISPHNRRIAILTYNAVSNIPL